MTTRKTAFNSGGSRDDSSSDASSGDDGETIEIIQGQIYDVKDKHGRWFEGKILKTSKQQVEIHYLSWAGYDETISRSLANQRIRPRFKHVAKWRDDLKKGDKVDIFIPCINRWIALKVVSKSGADIFVDGLSAKYNCNNEDVAEYLSHTYTRSGSSNINQPKNPNGVRAALALALRLEVSGDVESGLMIKEELASLKLLDNHNCIALYHMLDGNEVVSRNTLEQRRYSDARAALALEHAFAAGVDAHEMEEAGKYCFRAPADAQEPADEDDLSVEQNCKLANSSTCHANVPALLKWCAPFREMIHDWAKLSPEHQVVLEVAELLEKRASRPSTTLGKRRLLFAQAAALMEAIVARARDRDAAAVIRFRLARHYFNGLGIDATDPESQAAADFQASEYLRLAKYNRFSKYAIALLMSLGRRVSIDGLEVSAANVHELLLNSIGQGVQPAAYWRAMLIYEGWGDYRLPMLNTRKERMLESVKLLKQCEEIFDYESTTCSAQANLIEELAKHKHSSNRASFLLRLHIFVASVKEPMQDYFLSVLRATVKDFAGPLKLPVPTGEHDRDTAEWVTDMRKRLLSKLGLEGAGGDDKAKSGLAQQARQMLFAFAKHKFNMIFTKSSKSGALDAWTTDHVRNLFGKIDVIVDLFVDMWDTLQGIKNPLSEMEDRYKKLQSGISSSARTDKCEEFKLIWEEAKEQSILIYDKIPPLNRFLHEQIAAYQYTAELMKYESRVKSAMDVCMSNDPFECMLDVVLLARALGDDARERTPNIIGKHSKSAEALIQHAREMSVSVEEAKIQLDNLLRQQHVPYSGYAARVGYHSIIAAKKVADFMKDVVKRGFPNSQLTNRLNHLRETPDVNTHWRGAATSETLIDILKTFQEMVTARQNTMLFNDSSPVLNLKAITYADPWSMFTVINLDRALSDQLASLEETVRNIGGTKLEAMSETLTAYIQEKFAALHVHNDILNTLDRYHSITARIVLKKKMLFVLKYAPNVDWETGEGLDILGYGLNNGLYGRCPDGIASFCDKFILDYLYNTNNDKLKELPSQVAKVILTIAQFVFHYKMLFLRRHLSRDKHHYEGRTAGSITLQYMLMMPLSLPGEFGVVAYPRYATEGHADASQMSAASVCRRFLFGGSITHVYSNGARSTVDFSSLSLYTIIHQLRNVIVKSETGADHNDENEDALLEPAPRYNFTIDEEIIREFVKLDVIIGPYYDDASANEFTTENLFFHALRDAGEDENDEILAKPFMVQVLKDSAYVRLLEVCSYVSISPKFWDTITGSFVVEES